MDKFNGWCQKPADVTLKLQMQCTCTAHLTLSGPRNNTDTVLDNKYREVTPSNETVRIT